MLTMTSWQAAATIWLRIHILKYPNHLFFETYMNSASKEEAEVVFFLKLNIITVVCSYQTK